MCGMKRDSSLLSKCQDPGESGKCGTNLNWERRQQKAYFGRCCPLYFTENVDNDDVGVAGDDMTMALIPGNVDLDESKEAF